MCDSWVIAKANTRSKNNSMLVTFAWLPGRPAGAEFLEFLDHRPDHHPTVFMIDDAHLADSESMTAMTFALRRLHADHVMAVFALRGGRHR